MLAREVPYILLDPFTIQVKESDKNQSPTLQIQNLPIETLYYDNTASSSIGYPLKYNSNRLVKLFINSLMNNP